MLVLVTIGKLFGHFFVFAFLFFFFLFVICLSNFSFLLVVFQISTQKPFHVLRYHILFQDFLGREKWVKLLISFMSPLSTSYSSGQMALFVFWKLFHLLAMSIWYLWLLEKKFPQLFSSIRRSVHKFLELPIFFIFFSYYIFQSTKLHTEDDKFNKTNNWKIIGSVGIKAISSSFLGLKPCQISYGLWWNIKHNFVWETPPYWFYVSWCMIFFFNF